MAIKKKIVTMLELTRLSLAGALFGAALSGSLAAFDAIGKSDTRDTIAATIGFCLCFVILLQERRRLDAAAKTGPSSSAS